MTNKVTHQDRDLGRWGIYLSLLVGVYYLSARLGLMFTFDAIYTSPVWFPAGISFAAIFLFGYRIWPGIMLGALVTNISIFEAHHIAGSFTTLLISFATSIGNALGAVVGVYLLRHLTQTVRPFDEPQNVYRFVLAVFISCVMSAGVGTLSLLVGGIAASSEKWMVLLTWWLGDVSGILIIAPMMLLAAMPVHTRFQSRSLIECVSSVLLLCFIVKLIFTASFTHEASYRPLVYLLIPCMGWAAYRYGQKGVTYASLLVTLGAVWGTVRGTGPFAMLRSNEVFIALESFIILCGVIGLILAADLTERRQQHGIILLKRQVAVHWLTLFISVGLTIVFWNMTSVNIERRANDRFAVLCDEVQSRILERMNIYEQMLRSATGLFAASRFVGRSEWNRFIEKINIAEDFPGIQGIGFAKYVRESEKDDYILRTQRNGLSGFSIWPEGQRQEYVPVTYLEPMTLGNIRAYGYDMFSDPVRRAAMIRARDSGLTAVSDKVRLIRDTHDFQAGFIMYLPVYQNAHAIRTVMERRAALLGYVYAPFQMDYLIQEILDHQLSAVRLEVFNGREPFPQALMYSSDVSSDVVRNAFKRESGIEIEDHYWMMRFTSLPVFEETIDQQKAPLVLIVGAVISFFFFSATRTLVFTREKALALADEMISAREETEHSLRVSENRFKNTLEHAPIGMGIVSLKGTWLEVNKALCDIVGYDKTELIKLTFQDITHPDDLDADLEHITRLFEGKAYSYNMEKRYIRKDGQVVWGFLTASLFLDEEGTPLYFISQIQDITERKKSEEKLQSTLAFQLAVLNSANLSIVSTRPDGTIITFNRAAQRMLGYSEKEVLGMCTPAIFHDPEEVVRRTVVLSQELNRRIAPGFEVFVAKAREDIADENEWTYIRKDGSRFPVLLSVTAVRNAVGSIIGFLGIASDISDRKYKEKTIESALKEKETLLREVYHRVKNNLQVITSLFNLQVRTLPEGEVRAVLKEGANRVRAMALVHEKLYKSENLSSIVLADYIRDLCHQLNVAVVDARSIKIIHEVESIEIGLEKAIPLGLLLNELISNSLKHAFPKERKGEIKIKVYRDQSEPGTLVVEVLDNGVGFAEHLDVQSMPTLGLKLVTSLAAQLDGVVSMETDRGARTILTFQA